MRLDCGLYSTKKGRTFYAKNDAVAGNSASDCAVFLRAIFLKFAGAPLSIALFTAMSKAFHWVVPQPVFRLGSGTIETVLVLLLLIPKTARVGAALIAMWMVGAILSHIFVLGYGLFFVSALATFLARLYLFLTRTPSRPDGTP